MSKKNKALPEYPLWQWWESSLLRRLSRRVTERVDNEIYRLAHLKTALFGHILIQTNTTCTRKCSFCLYGMKDVPIKNDVMPDWLFKKIIGELAERDYSGRISLFEMNEPLTDPRIIDMAGYVKENLPKSWQYMVTNGDLLTEEKAVALIQAGIGCLQIMSYSPESYRKIKALRRGLPSDSNAHLLQDVRFDPVVLDNRGGRLGHIGQVRDVRREPCTRINHVLYIKPDGTAVSCFGDYFNDNVVGDAKKQTVTEIWFGEKFDSLRKNLNRGNRMVSAICPRCSLGKTRAFATRPTLEAIMKEPAVLNGAIVGASSSAVMFYPSFKKYSRVTHVISKRSRIDDVFTKDEITVTDDYGRVLSDPMIDYIFIANQNVFHYETAKQALLASKHVLVEKPVTLDLEQLTDLIEISREKRLILGGVFQWRFLNAVKIVKELLGRNELGKLLFVNGRVLWHRRDSYFTRGRGTWEMDGGGVLIKQAIHCVDLLIYLAGAPVSWHAYGTKKTGRRETEDTALMSFRFREGLGTLMATVSHCENAPAEVEIIGTQGRIAFNARDKIVVWDHSTPRPVMSRVNIYEEQIRNFINSVNNRDGLVVTPEECRKSLAVILHVYQSDEFRKGLHGSRSNESHD